MILFCFSAHSSGDIWLEANGILGSATFPDKKTSILGGDLGLRLRPKNNLPFLLTARIQYGSFSNGISENIFIPQIGLGGGFDTHERIEIFGFIFGGYSFEISDTSKLEGGFLSLESGMEYRPMPFLGMRISFRASPIKMPLNNENGYSSLGAGIGFSYLFGFKDGDRDGVHDNFDKCPGTPRKARVDKHGCPIDSDGDGVYDGLDRCPDTPFEALVDATGCPSDSDRDGVFDGVDLCDDTPKGIKVDSIGCPYDEDKDGIPDFADQCPNTPRGAIVNEFGCPKDSDEDGVYDGIDRCPQTPSGFVVNSVGCPYASPVELEVIYDAYDVGLNIKASAMQKLDQISERLRAHPYRIVEIGVHTDDEGSITYNINRGTRVAEKVRDIFIARGVKKESLVIKGYGETSPIAPNSTEEGRQKNRRIVIKYLRNE